MDGEPIRESSPPPDQATLRSIATASGTLSNHGKITGGLFRSKDYPLKPNQGWGKLTKIFAAQITPEGKKRQPNLQDMNVVLTSKEDVGKKELDYRIYKEGEKYRIEREERVETEADQEAKHDYTKEVTIVDALEGAARNEEARKLEKEVGLYYVDAHEAQRLLDTLNKLIVQEGLFQ